MASTPQSGKRLYHPDVTAALLSKRWESPTEVNLCDLNVDSRYQAPLSETRARAIAAAFRRESATAIVVSMRDDGTLWIIDGQTRAAAARKVALKTILAWVYTGLSLEEEAALYADANTVRKTPSSKSVFRARLLACEEPYVSINKLVEEAGLSLSLTNTKSSRSIACVGTIVQIWKSGKAEVLSRVLTIACAAWPETDRAFDAYILAGLASLLKMVGAGRSDVWLAERLSLMAPELICRKAALRKHDTGDEMGRCAAQVMLQHVEKRMRRANRTEVPL